MLTDKTTDIVDGVLTQDYGPTDFSSEWRWADGFFHTGIDFACELMAPIRTPRSGVVVRIGIEHLGDQALGIQFDNGHYGLFGHCERAAVTVGQGVVAGEVVAYAGGRPFSTGVFLHFEVRTDGPVQGPLNSVDPTPYLICETL
jgi:murein DD-endopeptidase MepM/ murein hydrolase activator NlpD